MRLTTGMKFREIFLGRLEVNPWLAHQELKGQKGF